MNSLTIQRLHLAARRDQQWSARIALERALASASLSDGRLVLVRRGPSLSLASRRSGPFNAIAQETALRSQFISGIEPVIARAMHGGLEAAHHADAVWFRDRREALACYLALLASGRGARGWFWDAALPHGFDAARASAVVQNVTVEIMQGGEDSVLAARVVREAARYAPLSKLLTLLSDAMRGSGHNLGEARPSEDAHNTPDNLRNTAPPQGSADLHSYPALSLAKALTRYPELAAALRHIDPAREPERHAVALAVLLAFYRPDMAASDLVRQKVSQAWLEQRTAGQSAFAFREASGEAGSQDLSAHARQDPNQRDFPADAKESIEDAAPAISEKVQADTKREDRPVDRAASKPDLSGFGTAFPGAGLVLAIPALVRLGFPEWLAKHPDLVQQDTARRVLLHLFAQHASLGLKSAALLLTGEKSLPHGPPIHAVHNACQLWHKGLDGWLRRTANCRLHDLAARDGWLHLGVERSHAAFPTDAIHMGLRRKALDVDPGWTPWLGISLRYVFSDRPETLEGLA